MNITIIPNLVALSELASFTVSSPVIIPQLGENKSLQRNISMSMLIII